MNADVGLALILAGSVLALLTAIALWRRLPGRAALVLLAAAGIIVVAGALLVQDEAGLGDWGLTLFVLGVLTPLHGRLVFGTPGRSP
jgi:hypothetical protein